MYKKTTNINDNGEIINEQLIQVKLWDEDKGLLWQSKNISTKMFDDVKLSEFITNKQEFANIHLLAEKIYKQTNAIMVRVSKTKVRFATIEDMCNIIDLCERNTRIFINKMIKLKILAKRIDKIGERREEKYLMNPLLFFSSKWLSADLYFAFKDSLDNYLTNWQKQMFYEYGTMKGEYVIEKTLNKIKHSSKK